MYQDGALAMLNAPNEVMHQVVKGMHGADVIRKSSAVSKSQNKKLVSECARTMRSAKSLAMFKIITLVLSYHIIHNLKEKNWGESLAKFYLHEKKLNCHCSSSKKPGVSSDSNTLESRKNMGKLALFVIFDFASKNSFFCKGMKVTFTKSQLSQPPKFFLNKPMLLVPCTNSSNILEFEKNHSNVTCNEDSHITKYFFNCSDCVEFLR